MIREKKLSKRNGEEEDVKRSFAVGRNKKAAKKKIEGN